MSKEIYAVIGEYDYNSQGNLKLISEVIENLRTLGEVNVFDLPRAGVFGDEVESLENLMVHHYACPYGKIVNADKRTQEIIRDVVLLGAKECYLDYGVSDTYLPIIKSVHNALKVYHIKIHTLNKPVLFPYLRNWVKEAKFFVDESRLQKQEELMISEVEDDTSKGALQGYQLYTIFEKRRAARKKLHQLRKLK